MQVFLDVVEFGFDPQEAVEAPRFNSASIFSSFGEHIDHPLVLSLEGRISKEVRDQLRRKGHQIEVEKDWGSACNPTMVEYDSARGVIQGGADVRGHRYALGW